MKIDKTKLNVPGIYVIKNIINNKIYVGKSKNCYKRLHQHLSDLKIKSRNQNENEHLLSAFNLYGEDNFECYLLEKFEESENLEQILADRELFWMKELDSLNKDKGYNLRWDSEGKCFVSDETREKISRRIKDEWDNGIRDQHSNKMKNYWNTNPERKIQQSTIMSKNKQKYHYDIFDSDLNLIVQNGTYQDLINYGLDKSIMSSFFRNKKDEVFCKGFKVIRYKINEEIVQPDSKDSDS